MPMFKGRLPELPSNSSVSMENLKKLSFEEPNLVKQDDLVSKADRNEMLANYFNQKKNLNSLRSSFIKKP